MGKGSLILVRCDISRGGFPSEKVFRVTQNDGSVHIGASPTDYFFTQAKKHFPSGKALPQGEWISGFLAARVIQENDDTFLVSVPLAEVLLVNKQNVADYPEGERAHVSFQS